MSATILDGRMLARERRARLAEAAAAFTARHGVAPCLAAVLAGGNPASRQYVESKARAAGAAGLRSETFHLAEDATEEEYLDLVRDLNRRAEKKMGVSEGT